MKIDNHDDGGGDDDDDGGRGDDGCRTYFEVHEKRFQQLIIN